MPYFTFWFVPEPAISWLVQSLVSTPAPSSQGVKGSISYSVIAGARNNNKAISSPLYPFDKELVREIAARSVSVSLFERVERLNYLNETAPIPDPPLR